MSPAEALDACEKSVRRNDPDRYFASLFAPGGIRSLLLVLYAFNHEIARAAGRVREPMMGELRLQWWRDAIGDAARRAPRAQPATIALSELFIRTRCRPEALEALVDARLAELSNAPFSDLAALESHASKTSGALMQIAASLLDAESDAGDLAREAGTAYGLAGVLRALPFHAAHGKNFLPADILAGGMLERASDSAAANAAVSRIVETASAHFALARALPVSRRVLPAVLPAALVPASLALVERVRRDVLRDVRDLSLFRRQLILLRAGMLGKL